MSSSSEAATEIAGSSRIYLRRLTAADEAEFLRLARASTSLHHPWMELPDTPDTFATFLARYTRPVVNIGLAVCDRASGAILGGFNINNIVYGRFQSAAIAYWAFAGSAGRGIMSEGLGLLIGWAFTDLGLHRLEANIQPGNDASIRLVKRNGFRNEGYSPDYLFIDGAWRDHERWAITVEMVDL
jgi:[ribosomal protein S5]-alanine N-acetyltransferase